MRPECHICICRRNFLMLLSSSLRHRPSAAAVSRSYKAHCVLVAAAASSAQQQQQALQVTVVGGGAAGLTAAFFAAREGAKVRTAT